MTMGASDWMTMLGGYALPLQYLSHTNLVAGFCPIQALVHEIMLWKIFITGAQYLLFGRKYQVWGILIIFTSNRMNCAGNRLTDQVLTRSLSGCKASFIHRQLPSMRIKNCKTHLQNLDVIFPRSLQRSCFGLMLLISLHLAMPNFGLFTCSLGMNPNTGSVNHHVINVNMLLTFRR